MVSITTKLQVIFVNFGLIGVKNGRKDAQRCDRGGCWDRVRWRQMIGDPKSGGLVTFDFCSINGVGNILGNNKNS